MNLKYLLAASTAALSLGLASPALAQNTNDNTNNTNTTNNTTNNSNTSNHGSSAATANSDGQANGNQDNDGNGNTFTDSSSETETEIEVGDIASNNDGNVGGDRTDVETGDNNLLGIQMNDNELGNGDNRDNEANDNGNNRDNEANDNGNNRDNEANENEDYGDGSASRGGEVEADADDGSAAAVNGDATNVDVDVEDNSENYGDGSASRGGEVSGNGNNRDNSSEDNDGNIVAEQEMTAIIANLGMDEVIDDTNEGYRSGNNEVRGNAFAAFAGILNQSWNTGVNANVQSGTNIAAQGNVNFGNTTNNYDGDPPS